MGLSWANARLCCAYTLEGMHKVFQVKMGLFNRAHLGEWGCLIGLIWVNAGNTICEEMIYRALLSECRALL